MIRNNSKLLTIEDYDKQIKEQRGISQHDLYDDDYDVGLSVNIINARRACGWTQKDLASAMKMKQPNIARFENTSSQPSHSMIKKIARALGLKPTPPGFEQVKESKIFISLPSSRDGWVKKFEAATQSPETKCFIT